MRKVNRERVHRELGKAENPAANGSVWMARRGRAERATCLSMTRRFGPRYRAVDVIASAMSGRFCAAIKVAPQECLFPALETILLFQGQVFYFNVKPLMQ